MDVHTEDPKRVSCCTIDTSRTFNFFINQVTHIILEGQANHIITFLNTKHKVQK